MNPPLPSAPRIDRGVLRFITAGSVDDGKSTLIGRLLYDSQAILADQLASLSRAGRSARTGGPIDLSLLTDGLEAEREQGITIDVAYRYFATPRRKFIIADSPGHEQYTRNMVTAASTADVAVVLIDATRVRDGELLSQTRRHSALIKLLGIEQVVVAVNKMDAIGFDRSAFETIVSAYSALAANLGLAEWAAIPLSALRGDNIASRSSATPWYDGPSLLEWLEQAPSSLEGAAARRAPLRLPVQWVTRGWSEGQGSARALAGRIASGELVVGADVLVLPAGQRACVAGLSVAGLAAEAAQAGEAVMVRLDRELDVSRGDWLVAPSAPPRLTRRLELELAWLDGEPLEARRRYLLRHGTRELAARVVEIAAVLDLDRAVWRSPLKAETLHANGIARGVVEVASDLPVDAYGDIRAGGAVVLIDPVNHRSVAAGMLRAVS